MPQDDTKATVWWGKAADQGHADAQHNLKKLYAKRQIVRQVSVEKTVPYIKAAAKGDAQAQINLERRYRAQEDYEQLAVW